jgi:hypothetical protein
LKVADDYAAFLRQTPWYEFPFGATLARFWRETPMTGTSYVRSTERRVSLSLEYGVKAVYARAMAVLAGLSPAALKIRSVVSGIDEGDLAPRGPITLIERRPDGTVIIETPRYRVFTEILQKLIAQGRQLVEIAGNDTIFVTVLTPPGFVLPAGDGRELINVPVQARQGWTRRGLVVPIKGLPALMQVLARSGAEFEHAYDY